MYCSPWIRARETAEHIKTVINCKKYYEDPRLREQEWGNFREDVLTLKIRKERALFGTFFYRMPYGESGADVYDRVSTFLETMYRDFYKDCCPEHIIVVSHGLAIKAFLMRFFHWSVEQFEQMKNPENCEIIILERQEKEWTLKSKLRKRHGNSYKKN